MGRSAVQQGKRTRGTYADAPSSSRAKLLANRLCYIALTNRQRAPLHESDVPPLLRFMVRLVICLERSHRWARGSFLLPRNADVMLSLGLITSTLLPRIARVRGR